MKNSPRKSIQMDYLPSKRIEIGQPIMSPSGHYSLVIEKYRSIPQSHPSSIWEIYTRGIVYQDGREILTINKENYDLWHYWLEHPQGEYLLCGHKANNLYQINLTTREEKIYDLKYWIPVDFYPSPDKTKLSVVGSDYNDELRIFTIDQEHEPNLTNFISDEIALLWDKREIKWINNETFHVKWLAYEDEIGDYDIQLKDFVENIHVNHPSYPLRVISDKLVEIIIKC